MSDFGAIISVTKTGDTSFSEEEFLEIEQVAQSYKKTCTYFNSIGESFIFSVGKTQARNDPNFYEVNILLSEYWGDAEMFKWHKETDVKDALIILNELQPMLSGNYVLKSGFEWW